MRTSAILLLSTLLGMGSGPATAADSCDGVCCNQRCDQCGRQAACLQKTCQVVCEVKKETKTCWCVEYQEICPLMPGCRQHGDECPPPPHCGNPKCLKKLVKKEYQVDVPVYKCVVRHLCSECLQGGSSDAASAAPEPAGGASQSTVATSPHASVEGPKIAVAVCGPHPEGLPHEVEYGWRRNYLVSNANCGKGKG